MEKYKTEIEKYIGTAEFDEGSGFIFGKQPDNTLNLVAEVRGWGAIQNMFEEQSEAQKFQDELGSYIADAINKKTKDNWNNAKDSYNEDEVIRLLNKFGNKVYGEYTRNDMMCDFTEKWFENYKKK
jgi:hypothetical protein